MVFQKKYHTQSLSIDNYSKIEYNELEFEIFGNEGDGADNVEVLLSGLQIEGRILIGE